MAAQKIGRASTLSRRRIVGTTPGGKHIAEKNIAEKIMAEQSYCWEEQLEPTDNIFFFGKKNNLDLQEISNLKVNNKYVYKRIIDDTRQRVEIKELEADYVTVRILGTFETITILWEDVEGFWTANNKLAIWNNSKLSARKSTLQKQEKRSGWTNEWDKK